jgi:hypothetical protein
MGAPEVIRLVPGWPHALTHIHNRREMVHADIKPANLTLSIDTTISENPYDGLGGGRLLGRPRTCCSLWVKVQSAFAQETVMPSQKRANEAARRLAGSDPVFGFQTENGTCLRVRPV